MSLLATLGKVKATDGNNSSRESYNTLTKLFTNVIKNPQLRPPGYVAASGAAEVIDVDTDEDKPEDDDTSSSDNDTEEEELPTDRRIAKTTNEWQATMKMSVAITGSAGVGKSHLINTMLEATFKGEYEEESPPKPEEDDAPENDDKVDSSDGYQRTTAYSFGGFAENKDALWSGSANKKTSVKPYNRYTAYSFETDEESAAASSVVNKGFSMDEFLEGSGRSERANRSSGGGAFDDDLDSDAMDYSADDSVDEYHLSRNSSSASLGDVDEEIVSPNTRKYAKLRSTYKRATVYVFNHDQVYKPRNQHPHRVPAIEDSGLIDKEFEPDPQFLSSIDWQKERGVNPYAKFSTQERVDLDDANPFILPQGMYGYGPQCILLRYSAIPELIVSFPKEGELRLSLWELHDIAKGVKRATSAKHLQVLQARYRRMLGLSEQEDVPLMNLSSPQDLPLASEVLALLGRNYRFVGLGRSLPEDRIYVREKLKEIVANYGYHMVRVMVRLPSSLLEGNKELVEISSLYASDPSTRMMVQNSNLVMVALDRAEGLTADVASLLDASGITHKMMTAPDVHKAVFIELAERHKPNLPTLAQLQQPTSLLANASANNPLALPASASSAATAASTAVAPYSQNSEFVAFKDRLTRQWRHVLLQSLMRSQQAKSNPNMTIDSRRVEMIIRDITVVSAKPILFTSLHLRDGFPLSELFAGLVSPADSDILVRRLLSSTGIPSLICSVPNRVLARMARAMKPMAERSINFSNAIATIRYSSEAEASPKPKLTAPTTQSAKSTKEQTQQKLAAIATRQKLLEQHMAALAMQLSQRKKELTTAAQQLQTLLATLSSRCVTAAAQAQLSSAQASTAAGMMVVQNIKQYIVKPFADEASSYWREVIEGLQLPSRLELMVTLTQSMLGECSAILELNLQNPSSSSLQLQTQIAQIQESVKSAPEQALKHLIAYRDVLQAEPSALVKDSTIKALQQHVIMTPDGKLGQVLDLPAFPPKALANVCAKFGQIVQGASNSLAALQSDLLATVKSVLFASKTQNSILGNIAVQRSAAAAPTTPPKTTLPAVVSPPSRTGLPTPATGEMTVPQFVPFVDVTSARVQEQLKRLNSTNVISGLAETIAKSQSAPVTVHYIHGPVRMTPPAVGGGGGSGPSTNASEMPLPQEVGMPASATNAVPDTLPPLVPISMGEGPITAGALFDKTLWERLPPTEREHLTTSFEQNLSNRGLQLVGVENDSSAQFRVLSHQLYGNQDAHPIVRLLVITEILNSPSLYERYIALRGVDVQEYVSIMSLEECRGDHLTLAAFANAFNVDLLVYSPAYKNPLLLQCRNRSSASPSAFSVAMMPNDDYASIVSVNATVLPPSKRHVRHKARSPTEAAALAATTEQLLNSDMGSALGSEAAGQPSDPRSKRKMQHSVVADAKRKPPKRTKPNKAQAQGADKSTAKGTAPATAGSLIYKTTCPTLVHLCVQKVVDNIDYCPLLEGLLPEELLHRILTSLTEQRRLTDSTVGRVLDPSMTALTLEGPAPSISDFTLLAIARKCHNLRSLKLINLSNITTNGLVQVVTNCPHIETLVLQGCVGVGDIAVQAVARKCGALSFLDLSGLAQFTDVPLQEVCLACPSLHTLILQHCNQLTDNAFIYLGPHMRVLDLTGCDNLTNQTLDTISKKCKNLHTLKLSSRAHNITESGIETLAANCGATLQVFEISNSDGVTDSSIQNLIKRAPHLTSLSVAFCRNITDAAFMRPSTSMDQGDHWLPEALEAVNVTMCLNVGSASVKEFARQCPLLQNINLGFCGEINDEALQMLAFHTGDSLRTLDLSKATAMSDAALVAVAENCKNLQRVVLRNCQQLTNTSLVALAKHCGRTLLELDLTACVLITDVALDALASSARRLLALSLSDCPKITHAGLRLLSCCRKLEKLRVAGSKALTDHALLELSEGCPGLIELDAAYCNNISMAALQVALAAWPKLSRLNLRGYSAAQGVPQANPMAQPPGANPELANQELANPAQDGAMMDAVPAAAVAADNGGDEEMQIEPPQLPEAGVDNQPPVPIPALTIQHKLLTELNLSWCKHVDDSSLAHVAEGCSNLVSLDLAWCTRITAGGVQRLVHNCTSLRTLSLRGCTGVGMLYLAGASIVIYR